MHWKQRAKLKHNKRQRRIHRKWLNALDWHVPEVPTACPCEGCGRFRRGLTTYTITSVKYFTQKIEFKREEIEKASKC